jgi:hypothetical protein
MEELFFMGVSLLPSGQAIRSYGAGLSHKPVSAAILNASRNKKPPVRTQAAGKKFHF